LHSSFVVQDELVKVFTSPIGATMTGTVHLFNPQPNPIRIRVYQADFTYNANDEHFYVEPGKYHRSNAEWIRFTSHHTIPANQNLHVPFTIGIPNQRNLVGTYWSVLFFEEDIDIIPRADEWTVSLRYAIQIVNTIENTGSIDLTFRDVSFTRDSMSLVIHNTGTLLIDAVFRVDIFDTRTELVARYTFERNRVYPELERRFSFPIQHLMRGNYYAVIVVDCGENRIFGHQVTFMVN